MKRQLFRFFRDDSGAVTVDWVVLTAAIIGLGFVVMVPIAFSTGNSAVSVGGAIVSIEPGYGNNP